jgi:3-oxoacyl-[acyl-carrier protein] reductase
LEKEVVLVTGASRGIGKAIALKLARQNYEVVIFGRDTNKLKEVSDQLSEYSTGQLSFAGEVSDTLFVNDSVSKVIAKYGRVDHLINNAGYAVFEKFVDSSIEQFKKQIDANVYGIYNFCKAVVDTMIERKNGSIINISSIAGKNGFVRGSMYAATKHAVQGFTKSLMLELREYNIRVASVCPGSVATEMIIDSPMQPPNVSKILNPENIADVVESIIKLPLNACVSEVEIRPTNPS